MSDTMKLWERSHWLASAARAFAKHYYKQEWSVALAHRGKENWVKALMNAAEEGRTEGHSGMEMLFYGAQKVDDLSRPKEALLEKATNEIIQKLRDGTYRAFGFDRPRTLETMPVQIPANVWTKVEKLDRNEVSYQSLRFIDVRVRMVSERADNVLVDHTQLNIRKTGRPTIKNDVEAAFHALNARGKIDVDIPAKAHFDLVRHYLKTTYPDKYDEGNAPGNEGIRAHFSPLFRELKKSRKQ